LELHKENIKDAREIAKSLLSDLIVQDDSSDGCYINVDHAIRANKNRVISFPIPNKTALSRDYLVWMCVQVIEHGHEWSVDKSHRWIGFIQCGYLQFLDPNDFEGLDRERDRVRNAPEAANSTLLVNENLDDSAQ